MTILACVYASLPASEQELLKWPMTARIFGLVAIFVATFWASAGLPASSSFCSSIGRPLMPPAALICSAGEFDAHPYRARRTRNCCP